jgi:hypothetical protein
LYSKAVKEVEVKQVNAEETIELPEHTRNLSTHYTVHYPDHAPRKATSLYNKTHRNMKDMECFICGKTNAKDGISVETHHFYCEKVFQTAFDWKKFGEFAEGRCNLQTGAPMDHFNWDEVAADPDLFVDSPDNMIVLCKDHHRAGVHGIHHVPFPEWIAQKFVKKGFDVLS